MFGFALIYFKRICLSNIYDKRDDFDFDIRVVNFPFLDRAIPRSICYGVYISQHIRFASQVMWPISMPVIKV